jgi:hypothetical protein
MYGITSATVAPLAGTSNPSAGVSLLLVYSGAIWQAPQPSRSKTAPPARD